MPQTLTPTAPRGFVRPRYDDGTFDEPLPLGEAFLEWLVDPRRRRIVLVGGRGSGLSTALTWLAELAAEAAPRARVSRLGDMDDHAWGELKGGQRVGLVDMSLNGPPNERLLAVSALQLPRARLVVGSQGWDGEWLIPGEDDTIAYLAPWSRDDLLELLGSSQRYREQRGPLFQLLTRLPGVAELAARPYTAHLVIEALLRDGADPQATPARLYAALLDGLQPGTLEVLRKLPPRELDPEGLLEALRAAEGPLDARELSDLFGVSYGLAAALRVGELRDDLASWNEARLAFPGLQHFLQLGECLQGIAQNEVPFHVPRTWLPYVPDLLSAGLREQLRGWLRADASPGPGADGVAATLLWAAGQRPPLAEAGHALDLSGALLDGLELPGAALSGSALRCASLQSADLRGARLEECDLSGLQAARINLAGARLTGALLAAAELVGADLSGAELAQVKLDEARLDRANSSGASLFGAVARCARLNRVDLAGADLRQAKLDFCEVEGLDLSGADLSHAELTKLALCELEGMPPALIKATTFRRCDLHALSWDQVEGRSAFFDTCELSDLSLREALLFGASFVGCRMHGVVCDGADLGQAVFHGVHFQAGSSRSGLLLGKPALEGSKTGFYTEGTSDDAWTRPEAIAQASFRGADLRGARFVDTNLFRVDLRGALLDPALRAQAKRQQAILDG